MSLDLRTQARAVAHNHQAGSGARGRVPWHNTSKEESAYASNDHTTCCPEPVPSLSVPSMVPPDGAALQYRRCTIADAEYGQRRHGTEWTWVQQAAFCFWRRSDHH